ncbi:amidohydrolase [Paraburkholderia sp. Ac-20336]|uniref:amidohydrolase family protein n=1 Tax=unclassified Paraburkholderia TaxID=2615204 RepID=UPI00197E875E|nr:MULTISPECIES: amidohydrolase family protein [unclassified Paraburkholderia]MBN3804058.1 amidohydrolase [Paraburkholderia sp. Ac-20336]MBN3848850.1 amidohydrolase [Paraburkholderia sp. Ac-20342]
MSGTTYDGLVIDAHCHIASTRFIPPAFFEGLCRNVKVRLAATGVKKSLGELLDMYVKLSQDHQGDALVKEMDSAGIAQAVLLLPDFTYVMKSELTIDEMFAEHHQILARHAGRFFVFGGVDPRWGPDGLALFEKGVDRYGVAGLKLYPPCGYSPSDRLLYPFYELCNARQLPVLMHIGPTSPTLDFSYSHPDLLERAAMDFPDVNFILAHGAIHHVEACVNLCAYRPNVYLDISAFLASMHPQGWRAALADLFRMGINHKILFGTDWPVFRNSGGHRKVMDMFTAQDGPLSAVSPHQRTWLMSHNAMRLLPEKQLATMAA